MSDLPYREAGEVTLEDVEASLWRLLAREGKRRGEGDVEGVLEVVRRFAETYSRKLGRSSASALSVSGWEERKEERKEVRGEKEDKEGGEEVEVVGSKWCAACERELDVSRFYRAKSRVDGLQARCKDCSAEARRRYREAEKRKKAEQRVTASLARDARDALRGVTTSVGGVYTP